MEKRMIAELARAVAAAEGRIRQYVRETPVEASPALSERSGAHVTLKLEQLQHTGSFKVRGAMHRLVRLTPAQRERGVVAASSGNHGVAVAYGGHALGVPVTVYVPRSASPVKLAAMRRLGAEVVQIGDDALLCELEARGVAERSGRAYVSPYNDLDVVAGQGTIGAELTRQVARIDAVLVAVGGGGLASGVAAAVKARFPEARVIGCLPERSPVMAESVRAGQIVELPWLPTLSDGTAGGIEPGAVTFELCRQLIDEFVLVSEAEIAAAMRDMIELHHTLVEGAAGVAVAGLGRAADQLRGQHAVVVLCGANVSLASLRGVLNVEF
jgi:threonine dehydratase